MRIYIFNHYAAPPDDASGTRHYSIARRLVRAGHEVTIFASSFNHATLRYRPDTANRWITTQYHDGVRFVWLGTTPYGARLMKRALNMISYAFLVLLAQIGRPRADWVVGSSVHPLAAVAGLIAARFTGARFCLELRDLWPQTLVDFGRFQERHPVVLALRVVERLLYSQAESIVTLMGNSGDYLAAHGAQAAKVTWIPNGFESELGGGSSVAFAGSTADQMARFDEWRDRYDFVAVYTGALGYANDVAVILEAALRLKRGGYSRVGVAIVGGGPALDGLRRLQRTRAVDNALVLDPVPKDAIPRILARCDAGLLHLRPSPLYRFGISPNKLFDYLGAGLPVVAAVDPVDESLRGCQAIVLAVPGDPQSLAETIAKLSETPAERRTEMGQAGRSYALENHHFDVLARKFERSLAASGRV